MKMTTLLLLSVLSTSYALRAEEITLPVISKPAVLQEGTQRALTAEQIADLLPWAKNSKSFLLDLLQGVENLGSADKLDRLKEGLASVVQDSAPKNSELIMRYAINRGLTIVEVLEKESNADAIGSIDAKNRVLLQSINLALKYYESDMQTISNKAPTPFSKFGVEYFQFLTELNKSIFDASSQYAIQRTSLEWLQWDLYRDLNNASYAAQIVKINNSLKIFPTKKITDTQAISFIRQMKGLTAQLDLTAIKAQNPAIEKKQSAPTTPTYAQQSSDNLQIESMNFTNYTDPKIDGFNLSYASNANGLCIALGHKAGAVSESQRPGSTVEVALEISLEARLKGASRNVARTASLSCLGKRITTNTYYLDPVSEPNLNGTYLSYSGSNADAACKAIGYEAGVIGSDASEAYNSMLVDVSSTNTITVGSRGNTSRIKNMICRGSKKSTPKFTVKIFSDPTIQDTPITYSSSEDQLCKLYGYNNSVSGIATSLAYNGSLIEINSSGSMRSTSGSSRIKNLTCVK